MSLIHPTSDKNMKSLMLMATALVYLNITSCNDKKSVAPSTINQAQLDRIATQNKKSKNLIKRLNNHFSEKGYQFSLWHMKNTIQNSNSNSTTPLTSKPKIIHCKGVPDAKTALITDKEVKSILTPEELQQLDTQYDLPAKNNTFMIVKSSLLDSYIEHNTKYPSAPSE